MKAKHLRTDSPSKSTEPDPSLLSYHEETLPSLTKNLSTQQSTWPTCQCLNSTYIMSMLQDMYLQTLGSQKGSGSNSGKGATDRTSTSISKSRSCENAHLGDLVQPRRRILLRGCSTSRANVAPADDQHPNFGPARMCMWDTKIPETSAQTRKVDRSSL